MTASQVYFASMRTKSQDSVPAKLTRLMMAAGLESYQLKDKFVAIKTHFGEMNNVSFLKPAYTRTIALAVKELGGRPFVTDCATLYPGMRANALDHLECAAMNGFSKESCACPVIIADGIQGYDEVVVPTPEGALLDQCFFGRAFFDADVVISLSHAKGSHSASYAGAIKNMSMGVATKAGKNEMHSDGKPVVLDHCIGCGWCLRACGQDAIKIENRKALITDDCAGCGHCVTVCPQKAVIPRFTKASENLQLKMAEYAATFVQSRECFHVAIAIDVGTQCDCFADNDAPSVPNIGMFASKDVVALDQAIADMINAQPVLPGSPLEECHAACDHETDNLHAINPDSDWELQMAHAEELGAGSRSYELVIVE